MKPRMYIETTVPSYLTAWPSRDLIRAARQQSTREWWAKRDGFDLFTSQIVVDECEAGDPLAAKNRLAAIAGIPLLEFTRDAATLAKSLMRGMSLPKRAEADSLHIAIAATHNLDYLLTWNCKHIANALFRRRIESICQAEGFKPPLICMPDEFLMGGSEDDRG